MKAGTIVANRTWIGVLGLGREATRLRGCCGRWTCVWIRTEEEPVSNPEAVKFKAEGRLARLTLSRPPLNVMNIAMIKRANEFLGSLSTRGDLCGLLIEAEGPIFSAGVDVPEHRRETVEQMIGTFHQTIHLIDELPMPVVAAVHGGAYGGGMELAIICDMVLAADDLKIGVPEITLGVYPPVAVAHLSLIHI